MPYYGHPLEFGTFITPVNSPPEAAVQRAQFSEQLGFDLVTFQDHPYQPSFLDTWTLMSWVAAQTDRIHVSANVLNVPLRPPAVLARAAASLDLLSGGRFDLALGAGGFWDAIEGMGGPRRTPGQAVDALGEAIDVIRGIWDAGNRAPLRIEGDYYRLAGAKRGPAAAHDIPIWVGALKPRMLRLIGTKADGWLPSLAYLKPGEFQAGNATIDEAAVAAGRDPREVRRLVNIFGQFGARNDGFLKGPSEQWVEELLPYVVEDGVGTLIFASDDPGMLQQFAEEVIPALRDAVDRERPASDVVVRSAATIAKRREGIDYDAVPRSLKSIEPGDFGYQRVTSTYMRGGAPGLVIQACTTAEVVEAVGFARAHPGVALGVRSGGHGISGRSTNDGGIVIDVGRLNRIEVLDVATRRVRVEPGARWTEVANALSEHGWALSSGDYGGVGVGGLATAGGIGWLVREHGLTIDHLVAAHIVLADGTIARASADENPDLFWAIRGAGANFGIVTSFEFVVDEVGDVGWAQLAIQVADTPAFLQAWGAAVEAAPRDLTSFMLMGGSRPGQPAVVQVMAVVDSNDPDVIIERLRPFAALGPVVDQTIELKPYSAIMGNMMGGDHHGQGEPAFRNGLVDHITPQFARDAADFIASGATHFFQIRSVGGAVSDVATDATAYANRSANFNVAAVGSHADRLNAAWEPLYPHFDGLYPSFDTDLRAERLSDAFPGGTLTRLRELKRRYDPDNLFRDNFSVG